jgi:type IX secretion system PorP/SprF family membrane protein
MKHITKIIGVIAILLMPLLGHSQQDPQYSQYTYAMGLINPAYVSSTEDFTVTALARRQWVGIEGAPETLTLSAGMSILNDRGGIALSVINDRIGPATETNVFADFSYDIPISSKFNLALGVRGGLNKLDVSTLLFSNDNFDPLDVPVSLSSPSLGFGVFLHSNKFYFGLAVPNMLNSTHIEDQNGFVSTASEVNHIFINTGYVFELNENLQLKPSAMVKLGDGGNNSTDVSLNLFIDNKVEVGLSYRTDVDNSFQGEAVAAILAFNVNKQFRIGYAFDYTLSQFQDFNSGTHELMLSHRFKLSTKVMSPRLF